MFSSDKNFHPKKETLFCYQITQLLFSQTPMSEQITILAENENYKAIINQLKEKFEINIYHWSDVIDDDEKFLWERVAGPFILDDIDQANKQAQIQLDLFSGEERDLTVTRQWKEELSKMIPDTEFECYKPQNYDIQAVSKDDPEKITKITATKLISINDLFLIESDQETWHIGFLADDRSITTWKKFKTLEEAIVSLNEE